MDTPKTVTDSLRAIADWLDIADAALKLVADAKSVPQDERPWQGTEVQDWLRAYADEVERTEWRDLPIKNQEGQTLQFAIRAKVQP